MGVEGVVTVTVTGGGGGSAEEGRVHLFQALDVCTTRGLGVTLKTQCTHVLASYSRYKLRSL